MSNSGRIVNDFSWKIAGEAGDGILNAGMMLAKTGVSAGLYTFATAEYPSLIRGGHNNLDVRISSRPITAHKKQTDILVAMNDESIDKHVHKLSKGGGIIYDSNTVKLTPEQIMQKRFERKGDRDIKLFPMPLYEQAMQCGAKIFRNVIAMGATVALLGFDIEYFNRILRKNFSRKGDAIVQSNIKAAKLGYDFVYDTFNGHTETFGWRLQGNGHGGRYFVSGNEAISLGAVKAGCKFFAAYPMTPASSLLHTMASFEKDADLVVKHTEDEIAAINMAIGASFAGVRSMTSTSGGGFSLMVEGFGLAAQTETPLVVVEAQRPGPATGMATHSGQGDLRFILHASTDEFPRIVIAPGSPEECFYLTIQAFNLAEKYQLPVVVLTDKYLGESFNTVEDFNLSQKVERGKITSAEELETARNNGGYLRYRITEDGVSPRSVPGQKHGMHVASSYEHDELGFEREEEEIRTAMHKKRFRKLETAKKEIPNPELVGSKDADITIVTWGSTTGPVKEAMMLLDAEGIKANLLQVVFMNPFPSEKVRQVLQAAKKSVVVEGNMTSQLNSLIKENCLMDVKSKILRFDGRPFNPEDIAEAIKEVASGREGVIELNKESIKW